MRHRLPTTKAREQFAELPNEVGSNGKRVILDRHGKDVVAMIPTDDLVLLEELGGGRVLLSGTKDPRTSGRLTPDGERQ